MPRIDESLAKGLASRFLRELGDAMERVQSNPLTQDFLFNPDHHDSKKRWLKAARKYKHFIDPYAFASYEIGTKSKPAVAFVVPRPMFDYQKEFDEEMIGADFLISRFSHEGPVDPVPPCQMVKFSKHALSRLIQRASTTVNILDNWSIELLVRLMRPAILFSGFWITMIVNNILPFKASLHFHSKLELFAPSPYGFFKCVLNLEEKAPFLEIKTFLNTEQLNPKQKELRKSAFNTLNGLSNYPIGLAPWDLLGCNFAFLNYLVWIGLLPKRKEIEEFICERLTSTEREIFQQLEIMNAPERVHKLYDYVEEFEKHGINSTQFNSTQVIVAALYGKKLWPKIWSD